MFALIEEEVKALYFVLTWWLISRRSIRLESTTVQARIKIVNAAMLHIRVSHELSVYKDADNVVIEVLYDFLVVETMNEVRGLLSPNELRRLETLRTIFAKILANAPSRGREVNIGSLYLVPAELVKVGLYKMLRDSQIELLHYARKSDSGMLGVIARFFLCRDFEHKKVMH